MVDEEVTTKKWYKSKTVIINVITIVALIAQTQAGFVIAPDEQVGLLAVANLVLRIVTTRGLDK